MDFKLFIIVASPLVRKVGLALTGIKTSQNVSLTSMNLCVEILFSEVQSAE